MKQDFIKYLDKLKGQALHARTLEFIHPTKNKWVRYETEISVDFKKNLELLEKLK